MFVQRILPTVLALTLIFAGVLIVVPTVTAATCDGFEGFEDDPNFGAPTGCWYTATTLGTTIVDTTRPYQGTKSLHSTATTSGPSFITNPAQVACAGTSSTVFEVEFFFNLASLPPTSWQAGIFTSSIPHIYMQLDTAGTPTFFVAGAGNVIPSGGTGFVDANVWYGISFSASCNAGAGNDDFTMILWEASNPSNVIGASILDNDSGSADAARIKFLTGAGSNGNFWIDNIQVPSLNTLDSNQVAVTDLVGYSMDSSGRNIIVRTDNGETVESYAVSTLTNTGTFATPNCALRLDGVITETFEYNDHSEIYTSFIDCDGSGDSDTLRVRSDALTAPVFYEGEFGTSCEFQEADNVNDGDTDIPNEIGEIGVITSMTFDFRKCSDTGINYGAAAWTFSEVDNGRIGIYAVLYQTGQDDEDKADVQLDTASPLEITHFCSWRNTDEVSEVRDDGTVIHPDYMAAVTITGPTGIYRANADITDVNGIVTDVETSLSQRFLNSGQYGNAIGIGCTKGLVAIVKTDSIAVINGTTQQPATADPKPGFPKTIVGDVRGVAMTGSGRFVAYVNGANIEIADVETGNITIAFPVPTGGFRGMEFDESGEHLAVFTTNLITVYESGPVTCQTTDTCAEDSNPCNLDNPDCSQAPPTTSPPVGGGFGGGGGILGLAADLSVYIAIGVILGFAVVGWALTGAKKRDGE